MKINTDKKKIEEILTRGVNNVIEPKHLKKQLLAGRRLTIYFGIDPTSPVLHLGHSIILKKLTKFQELGHRVILLIGDFTAKIGDPTDKMATRQPLTDAQVKENMKTYKEQAGKILDFGKVELKYNSAWLSKLNFEKILEIASNLSVPNLLTRDMFAKRMDEGKTIGLHEFLYPLMQGYDSVAMNVDLEIAGADQLFNMLVGRELQKVYNNKEKDVLTTQLLLGTDGKKMSKTAGNTIALTEKPKEMFGKIMSLKDGLIRAYFELTTDLPLDTIKEIIKKNRNPRNQKAILAKEIVKMYHSEKAAIEAKKEFENVFSKKLLPKNIKSFVVEKNNYGILDLLKDSRLCQSKGEAKRLIGSGGVRVIKKDKENIIRDWQAVLALRGGEVIKVGKRRFIKIKLYK